MQERQASFGLPAPTKSSLQRLREEINNKKAQKQKTTSTTVISTPANKRTFVPNLTSGLENGEEELSRDREPSQDEDDDLPTPRVPTSAVAPDLGPESSSLPPDTNEL